VDSISWNDCQEWLQRLNRWLTSEWSCRGGNGEAPQLVLPGEGQWEAGCRAGAATPFHFGDVLDATWANFDGGYPYGPSRKGVYRQRPVPVGFFGLVNRWGLAELHGQLFEWCGDQWHPEPTGESWPSDGLPWQGVDPVLKAMGTVQKEWKLLRGGSWFNEPSRLPRRLPGQPPPGRRQPQRRRSPLLSPPPRFPSWFLSPWALGPRAVGFALAVGFQAALLFGWRVWRRRRLDAAPFRIMQKSRNYLFGKICKDLKLPPP
jgi:hypothetical protein